MGVRSGAHHAPASSGRFSDQYSFTAKNRKLKITVECCDGPNLDSVNGVTGEICMRATVCARKRDPAVIEGSFSAVFDVI